MSTYTVYAVIKMLCHSELKNRIKVSLIDQIIFCTMVDA